MNMQVYYVTIQKLLAQTGQTIFTTKSVFRYNMDLEKFMITLSVLTTEMDTTIRIRQLGV